MCFLCFRFCNLACVSACRKPLFQKRQVSHVDGECIANKEGQLHVSAVLPQLLEAAFFLN
jgi:hypothetical protein